jgi:hypothetical protein
MSYRMCMRIRAKAAGRPELAWARELASMIQVSLVGFAVGGAFLGLAYFDLPYSLMAIVVLTNAHVDRALAAQTVARPGDTDVMRASHPAVSAPRGGA